MSGALPSDAQRFVDALVALAVARPDVRAVALVGSHASGTARSDSDVDLVLLTTAPQTYTRSDGWIEELHAVAPIATRQWGVITERRLALSSGREVDLGVDEPSWAAITPLDVGAVRVARDGLTALYDPDGLLRQLLAAVR